MLSIRADTHRADAHPGIHQGTVSFVSSRQLRVQQGLSVPIYVDDLDEVLGEQVRRRRVRPEHIWPEHVWLKGLRLWLWPAQPGASRKLEDQDLGFRSCPASLGTKAEGLGCSQSIQGVFQDLKAHIAEDVSVQGRSMDSRAFSVPQADGVV